MRNELRMYFCEVLLNLIISIVPNTENGLSLVKAIKKYTEKELNLK